MLFRSELSTSHSDTTAHTLFSACGLADCVCDHCREDWLWASRLGGTGGTGGGREDYSVWRKLPQPFASRLMAFVTGRNRFSRRDAEAREAPDKGQQWSHSWAHRRDGDITGGTTSSEVERESGGAARQAGQIARKRDRGSENTEGEKDRRSEREREGGSGRSRQTERGKGTGGEEQQLERERASERHGARERSGERRGRGVSAPSSGGLLSRREAG